MAERSRGKSIQALVEELIEIGQGPLTDGEIHTYIVQETRAMRNKIGMQRVMATILERSQHEQEQQANIKRLDEEYDRKREQYKKDEEAAVARHKENLARRMKEAEAEIEKEIATAKAKAQQEITAALSTNRSRINQLDNELKDKQAEVDKAIARKNELEAEAMQIQQTIATLQRTHLNTVKEQERVVNALQTQANALRQTVNQMRRERDEFLSKFG